MLQVHCFRELVSSAFVASALRNVLMVGTVLFFIFAGLAIAAAISMVYHKNPLYSAISLVGVFVSLSCIYVTLAAPFIAAVQILIYAGAIMVLVVFVIMLLNLDDDRAFNRLNYLYALGGGLGVLMYTEYLLPVEIVGILLLMAVIGGVVLARRLAQPQLELVVEHELELEHQDKGLLN